ncbi:hypothetical protein POJ06DRAFT_265957 [Lipomyces tetrasporus]|uniref:Uncharacterized protein n=1 Tax=Lipomyces tetrasporus TaxID=54092 RepID=A0AAD7R073_9ASCO|nr:uncharacterized protein POJ06DRAFT_265957 [Lipomyces tetrasporus]KAJ8103097.1 hypothetical protein POJ06DRAFT_265957 [Lipomyces tetrasporus]
MVTATNILNAAIQAEAAVVGQATPATGPDRSTKTSRITGFLANIFNRKASENKEADATVHGRRSASSLVDDRGKPWHLRRLFHRNTSTGLVDGGQKQAARRLRVVKLSRFRKVFGAKAQDNVGNINEAANVGIVSAASRTAGKLSFLNRIFTKKELPVIDLFDPVDAFAGFAASAACAASEVAAAEASEDPVVVIGTTTRSRYAFNPDCVHCSTQSTGGEFFLDHSMISADSYDSHTLESVAVEDLILVEIKDPMTPVLQEVELDSFSTVDLSECKTEHSDAAGHHTKDILPLSVYGNVQENNDLEVTLRLGLSAPATPSYGLSVITNTVCGVLGSIGEHASQIVQQQLAAARQQPETASKQQGGRYYDSKFTPVPKSMARIFSPYIPAPSIGISSLSDQDELGHNWGLSCADTAAGSLSGGAVLSV